MTGYKKSEETKRKIIESAAKLFAKNGYVSTTVKDICDDSRVSVSRVNYHFHSKAELAGRVCEIFLDNLYLAIKNLLENKKEYSLLSEVIQLRCFIHIFHFSDENPYARFYRDIIETDIGAEAFVAVAHSMFGRAKGTYYVGNQEDLETKMDLYARVYAGALAAIMRIDQKKVPHETEEDRMDMFAKLFMQMLDIPHDVEDAILKRAKEYDSRVGIEMLSLTEVRVFLL